jgi:hypothetical protein
MHVATLTSGVWESAAIVVGGSIAALAVLLGAPDRRWVDFGIAVLAVGVWLAIEMWRHNWSRHKFFIDCRWARMREIENARGMKSNILSYLLGEASTSDKDVSADAKEAPAHLEKILAQYVEWRSLSSDDKERLAREYGRFPRPSWVLRTLRWIGFKGSGQDILQFTALLVQWGWILMAVFKLVDAFLLADSAGVHHFHP